MSGTDLVNNLIDELGRARSLLQLYVNGIEVPETTSEELIDDIDRDLDRYYDVADNINKSIKDIEAVFTRQIWILNACFPRKERLKK